MTSLDEYYNGSDSYLLAGLDEEPLEIENWMTDLHILPHFTVDKSR